LEVKLLLNRPNLADTDSCIVLPALNPQEVRMIANMTVKGTLLAASV
jgi:hypothetical protein